MMQENFEQNEGTMLAGRNLEERYCHLGKMDKCLEIRKRVHKATEGDHFKTEIYDMKNKKLTKGQVYRKTDSQTMYDHYLTYGQKEGRKAYPGAKGGEAVDGIADTKAAVSTELAQPTADGLVPLDQLAHIKSLKKKCTDAEFAAAYDVAAGIVTPLVGMSREDQLYMIASAIRYRVDSGQVYYTTDEAHYDDPYGYFVTGVASCAGCARATGLCLDLLGIPYEHVNEGLWSHQWCRVNMGDSYWICDAFGLYVGPEPSPYGHPLVSE